jgi:hypothetical protein
MRHINFQLIEDNRFPNRPLLQDQISNLSKALSILEVEFSISQPRFLDWGNGETQQRSDVNVHYQPYRGKRKEIIIAVNEAIPAPYYKFS